jgi:hypothetical protein
MVLQLIFVDEEFDHQLHIYLGKKYQSPMKVICTTCISERKKGIIRILDRNGGKRYRDMM